MVLMKLKQSSLVAGAGTYILASMINAAIPFFLLPVLTRYLDPSQYGEVAVFQVWVSLIGAICGLSVHGAANRKYFDYQEPDKEMGRFIAACLFLLVISSAVLLVVVVLFSSLISGFIGLSQKWLLIGVPFAFCNFLIQLRLGQWQVRKQARKFGVFQISQSFLNMLLSLFLVVVLLLGVDGRLTGYTLSVFLFGAAAIILLRKDGLITWSWRPDLMKEAAAFGVPLIPHVVGAFLLLTIDRAIVSSELGLEAAGYYMVAAQLAMVLGLFLDSINKAYVPWLFENIKRNDNHKNKFIVKLTYGYNFFLLFCALIAFLLGKPILVFVAGERYAPAGELVGWLVLAQSMRGMYYMMSSYIFFSKRTGLIAKITIFSGVVNVALMYTFINRFGLIGAAWAASISMLIQWLVTWWFANHLVRMPWSLRGAS